MTELIPEVVRDDLRELVVSAAIPLRGQWDEAFFEHLFWLVGEAIEDAVRRQKRHDAMILDLVLENAVATTIHANYEKLLRQAGYEQ